MKTFTFDDLPPLQDFQFLTDSSGYLLTQSGQLYQFAGQRAERVATPGEFTVTHFLFRDQAHGAVVGVATGPPIGHGGLGGAALLGLALAGLLWGRRWQPLRLLGGGALGLLASGLLLACSGAWRRYQAPDPTSAHATLLSQPLLHRPSFHHYVGNKGVRSFMARTDDQGRTWDAQLIPSNFYPTALAAIGGNYLVGTYAREQAGAVPLHADGDLWLYGTDATRTPQLANNSGPRPYCISLSRGVTGLLLAADSVLYVFGSDRMPTLPSTVMSATAGNIYQLPTSLHPPTRLLDTPDTVDVRSLARAATGELWATMAGRKPHLSHGNLGYVPLPTRQLLRFTAGRWQSVAAAGFTSFAQVEFVPGTTSGYLLTDTGEVLETRDSGGSWHLLPGRGVRRLHAGPHAITWLRGTGQLAFRPVAPAGTN